MNQFDHYCSRARELGLTEDAVAGALLAAGFCRGDWSKAREILSTALEPEKTLQIADPYRALRTRPFDERLRTPAETWKQTASHARTYRFSVDCENAENLSAISSLLNQVSRNTIGTILLPNTGETVEIEWP